MALKDDQVMVLDPTLRGRFVAAVKAWAAGVVEELPPVVPRMAIAKKITIDRKADELGGIVLELAMARNQKLRAAGIDVLDEDIAEIVERYLAIFAREAW